MKPRVLITAANRGLGLEFARAYAADGWAVVGTSRDTADTADLRAAGDDVTVLPFDARDDESSESLVRTVGNIPLDVVIANAGVGDSTRNASEVTREMWTEIIGINTWAPFRLAVALRPNLERGTHKKLVGISSLAASMGSGYNVPGGYIYRASKTALNQLYHTLSVEWRPLSIVCLVMRPGRARTKLTGFRGDISAEESATGMKQAIMNATLDQTGSFIGYDGQQVAW